MILVKDSALQIISNNLERMANIPYLSNLSPNKKVKIALKTAKYFQTNQMHEDVMDLNYHKLEHKREGRLEEENKSLFRFISMISLIIVLSLWIGGLGLHIGFPEVLKLFEDAFSEQIFPWFGRLFLTESSLGWTDSLMRPFLQMFKVMCLVIFTSGFFYLSGFEFMKFVGIIIIALIFGNSLFRAFICFGILYLLEYLVFHLLSAKWNLTAEKSKRKLIQSLFSIGCWTLSGILGYLLFYTDPVLR